MTTDDGGICVVCLLFAPSGGVVRYMVGDAGPDDEVVVCLKCARGLAGDAAFESVVRINDALLERIAALEGHLLGIRLWAVDQSESHDAFTRRNGGQVVKPNAYDSFAERLRAALHERASTPVGAAEIAETLRGVPCKACGMPWETFYDVAVHNVICRFVPDFEAMAEAVRALLASGGAVRAEHRDAQSDERG